MATLALAVAALWFGSLFWSFQLIGPLWPDGCGAVYVSHGFIDFRFPDFWGGADSFDLYVRRHEGKQTKILPITWWWFKWDTDSSASHIILFPLWLPFIVFSSWPILALVRCLWTQPAESLCTKCGYDLRGSKGSATCPECGEAIRKEIKTK